MKTKTCRSALFDRVFVIDKAPGHPSDHANENHANKSDSRGVKDTWIQENAPTKMMAR
ncbi:hypothetical protein D3C77_259260 [compost metagenome]